MTASPGDTLPTAADLPILLGMRVSNGTPVHLERSFLGRGHVHIRGRTGAGKTSRGILPLVLQLLSAGPSKTPAEPIFIFDFGGDRALFHSVKAACGSAGRVFRFLSLNPDDDWDYFDPFQAVSHRRERIIDLAEMLIEAFSMEYGPIYGGLYFTQQNLRALLRVAEHLVKRKETSAELTIEDISKFLERNARRVRDAEQIRAMFEFLGQYPQLKPHLAPSADRVIDLQRAIDQGEVIYFFLPSMGKSITVRPIGGLALYSLQQLAMRRPDLHLPIRRTWVFIDEFQSLAGRSFENFLAQCRKFGLTLVLCHQTLAQLRNSDSPLDDIVAKNTAVKLYFTAEGPDEIEELQAYSHTARIILRGTSRMEGESKSEGATEGTADTYGGMRGSQTFSKGKSTQKSQTSSSGTNEREQIMPALEINEIQEVSATDGQFFLIASTGHGHTQPTAVQGFHCITAAMHHEFGDRPLPKRAGGPPPGAPVAKSQRRDEPAPTPSVTSMRDPARQAQLAQLAQAVNERLMMDKLPLTKRQ